MAVEFQLLGNIQTSRDLRDLLCAALGAEARISDAGTAAVEFELVAPLVMVSAFHSPSSAESLRDHGMRGDTVLFFRVLDKTVLSDAIRVVVVCVRAILTTVSSDMLFLLNGETPLLARRGSELEAFLWADESDADFWRIDGRLTLLGLPCRMVRKRRSLSPPPVTARRSNRRQR